MGEQLTYTGENKQELFPLLLKSMKAGTFFIIVKNMNQFLLIAVEVVLNECYF